MRRTRIRDPIDAEILHYYAHPHVPETKDENPSITGFKVLVLVPAYNNAKLLPIWFNYLLKLNPQPTKYVFLENNSTDNTLQLLTKFGGNNKKIIRLWLKDKPIADGESPYTVIANIRQLLLAYARRSDCDYAIFLDTDIFPVSTNLIEYMVAWGKDVVGGKYMRFFPDGLFIASYWNNPSNPQKPFLLRAHTILPFQEVACTSGGCLCLSKRIIQDRRVNFYPIYPEPPNSSEDFGYCLQARSLGYKVYLDGMMDLRHFLSDDKTTTAWKVTNEKKYVNFEYGKDELSTLQICYK